MLKLLACLFMLLDHIGFVFADQMPEGVYFALRAIGRLAFPIFVWLIARGYDRTRNRNLYFIRLLLFAALSEVILRFAYRIADVQVPGTNVLFTFSLAIAAFAAVDLLIAAVCASRLTPAGCAMASAPPTVWGRPVSPVTALFASLALSGVVLFVTRLIDPDYGFYGLAAALGFLLVNRRFPQMNRIWPDTLVFTLVNIGHVLVNVVVFGYTDGGSAVFQSLSVLAVPICHLLERNRRPSAWTRYAFYVFYPLHLLILCLIRSAI